jgi:hypothetical protein
MHGSPDLFNSNYQISGYYKNFTTTFMCLLTKEHMSMFVVKSIVIQIKGLNYIIYLTWNHIQVWYISHGSLYSGLALRIHSYLDVLMGYILMVKILVFQRWCTSRYKQYANTLYFYLLLYFCFLHKYFSALILLFGWLINVLKDSLCFFYRFHLIIF